MDPFTAIATASTAYNTVKKLVGAGQEFENVVGQMGKWYTAVADFRRSHEMHKNPPLFKKYLDAGSVEEEALNLLIHEKKIMEMEKELRQLLNWRFGANTWTELKEMRRKIKAQREIEVYRIAERKKAVIHFIQAVILSVLLLALISGIGYFLFLVT